MRRKNKQILLLLCIGVILTVVVTMIGMKQDQEKKAYSKAQFDATTSDMDYITPYRNPYMGNASNIINMFYHLPLGGNSMKFHIFSDKLTVQVTYESTLLQAGETNLKNESDDTKESKNITDNGCVKEVKKSLIYNSTAAFALIGNLHTIEYVFSDVSYQVDRSDIEGVYTDFEDILNKNNWKTKVQKPLEKEDYINDIADRILIKK